MSKVIHLELAEELDNIISNGKVLVDFYATWCRPCQMLGPVLDELSEEVDYKIVKIDVDKFPELAGKYGVRSIPTLVVTKDGELVATELGFKPKDELNNFVQNS